MLPTDLDIARLCSSSESSAPTGFDIILDGAETGIWAAVRHRPDGDDVIFRGSWIIQDWWRDAQAEMISYPGLGLVHSGFIKGLPEVCKNLAGVVRQPYTLGGHSLGAAHCCLAAPLMPVMPQKIVLFGCPRPGGNDLAVLLKDIPISSYKNRHDPVTDVPLPLPELAYTHVREFIPVDGMVDFSLGPPWDDHHCKNYVAALEIEGMKNAESATRQ